MKKKLRIVLVYPPFQDKRDRAAYYVVPPLGLLYLASYLENDGYEVTIKDFLLESYEDSSILGETLYHYCSKEIVKEMPDLVCFSTQCSTNPGSLNIARLLKKMMPSTKILLGGHDVSFLGVEYLHSFDFVDFVLAGEAELTICKLARHLDGEFPIEKIENLTYRSNKKIYKNKDVNIIEQLDKILPPAYHLVKSMETYFKYSKSPTILIDSGRGCAYSCEFCQTTLLTGTGKIRYKSVESIMSELKLYKKLYGNFEAYFVHDLFTAKRSFVLELCNELINEKLDITWQCRCRIDQVDRELLRIMKKAGCRMLLYGIESGASSQLEKMNKKIKKDISGDILERVNWTVEEGIFPSLSMVIGIPEETLEELEATLTIAAEFQKIGCVNSFIQLMSPLPGTALANRIFHKLEYKGQFAPTAFNQGIEFNNGKRLNEDEILIQKYPKIFQSFYSVMPDHGDFGLCVDISLAYCKLLEVYVHTFCFMAEILNKSKIELFKEFKEFVIEERNANLGLYGIKDYEIWEYFRIYFNTRIKCISHNRKNTLKEIFKYESLVNEISTSEPIDDSVIDDFEKINNGFTLHPSAKLFSTRYNFTWLPSNSFTGRKKKYWVLYSTSDRINVLQIDKQTFLQLELLINISKYSNNFKEYYSHFANSLSNLSVYGIFKSLDFIENNTDEITQYAV